MGVSRRALGLLFLFVTAAAWIGASFITQALVAPGSGQQPPELEPWLLTLICSSTFMIYLPIGHYSRRRARAAAARTAAAAADGPADSPHVDADADASDPMLPKAHTSQRSKARALGGATPVGVPDIERQPLLQQSPALQAPQRLQGDADVPDAEGGSSPGVGGDADGEAAGGEGDGTGEEVSMHQIVRAALLVAPVWFAAQLTFTAALEFTSVTSNTVLSSCSSLFVYLGSLALGQEVGSNLRLASVVAAMAGTTLVALGDSRAKGGADADGGGSGGTGGGSAPLLGDALTLLAAALYAAYTLIMKRMLVKDDAAVMALFFGCIGALCFAVLAPLAGGLALAGSGVVLRVTGPALGLALLQGLIDYVAADYAWARAVMLLGPTATSCGLAMQIPAAAIVDSLVNGNRLAWSDTPASLAQFLLGSVLIISGFIGVSVDPRVAQAAWERWQGRRRGRGAGAGSSVAWHQGGKALWTVTGSDADAGKECVGQEATGLAHGAGASVEQGGSAGSATGGQKRKPLARALGISGTQAGNGEAVYIPLGDKAASAGFSGRTGGAKEVQGAGTLPH